MKLKIYYSIDYEVDRILTTLSKLEWYKTNGYNPKLPDALDITDVDKITKNDIRTAVSKEYDEQSYFKQKQYAETYWNDVAVELKQGVAVTGLLPQENYNLFLTRYGVSGSYNLPDSIIINIQYRYGDGMLRVIAHEATHLMIQKFIDQYKIEHWVKERVVDLLTEQFVPSISKFQTMSIDTQKIDATFKLHYPNVELILKSLGSSELAKRD